MTAEYQCLTACPCLIMATQTELHQLAGAQHVSSFSDEMTRCRGEVSAH